MTQYTNPLYPLKSPANQSYTSITFTTEVFLLWPIQNITDTSQKYVANQTDLSSTAAGTVILPPVGLQSAGVSFELHNLGSFTISVLANDNTSVVNITSGQTIKIVLKASSTTTTESVCWETIVLGASTNTNTLAQNLGSSLKFIASTNNVQVSQLVTSIPVALPFNGVFYRLDVDRAITYCSTTLVNLASATLQTNILLGVSSQLYSACGFFINIANEAATPVVIETQSGDTINGVPIQSTSDSASFVLVPGASCTVTSSSLGGYLITNQSSQYQNVFRNVILNLSTANYIGLTAQSSFFNTQIAEITEDPLTGAAVAIDMSKNLDMMYSPLWTLVGTIPADIQTQIEATGGTFWIILPNNLNALYFVLAQASSTLVKFGLVAKYNTNINVSLPTLNSSWEVSGNTTWAIQYSAQITNSPLTQLIVELLIAGQGGTGAYPDITDDPVTGLVSITGVGGLVVTKGHLNAPAIFSNGRQVAVIIPGTPTVDDIVTVGTAGSTRDSGVKITSALPSGASTNFTIPTSLAVYNYVNQIVTSPLVYQGVWDPATNTPTLDNSPLTPADAEPGWLYVSNGTGTVNFGGGDFAFVPGDFVILDQSSLWVKIARADTVTSVNGAVGAVQLYLQSLLNVSISSAQEGDVLTYAKEPFFNNQTITVGDSPSEVVTFVISSSIFIAVTNFNSDNISVFSTTGGTFTLVQTTTVGDGPSGITYIVNAGTPTLCVTNATAGTVTTLKYNGSLFVVSQTITVGTHPIGCCGFTITDVFFAIANNGSANCTILKSVAGANFTVSQTIAAAANPYDVTAWANGPESYLAISNNGADTITVLSAAAETFAPFQVITGGMTEPRGITSFTKSGEQFLAVANYLGGNVSVFVSLSGGSFTPYQVFSADVHPIGIDSFTIGLTQYIAIANNGSNNTVIFESEGTAFFEFYQLLTVGTAPVGVSHVEFAEVSYLITANSGSDNLTADLATSKWIAGKSSTESLDDLSDVTITSPTDNQVLTYDSVSAQWVNRGFLEGYSDFNELKAIGAAYTVILDDVFKLLGQSTISTITFTSLSTFDTGNTICVDNNIASQIILIGAVGSDTITMTGNSYPAYYKIETDGANWLINNQRQDLYAPIVNTTTINNNTVLANLAVGSEVNDAAIVSTATINNNTVLANLAENSEVNDSTIVTQSTASSDNYFVDGLSTGSGLSYTVLVTDANTFLYQLPFPSFSHSYIFNASVLITAGMQNGFTVCIKDQANLSTLFLVDIFANANTINFQARNGYYKVTWPGDGQWYVSYSQVQNNYTP